MRRTQVAVVGGGPAGLAAAVASATAGAGTVLLDEQPEFGGQLRYRTGPVATRSGEEQRPSPLRATLLRDAMVAGVDLRPGSIAWGLFADNLLGVVDGSASYQLAAEAIVVATGSTDLALPFAGASLPGVFSARAIQILLNLYRVLPGRRFAVLGPGPEAAEVVNDIRLAGGEVVITHPANDAALLVAEGEVGVRAVAIDGTRHAVDIVVVAMGRQPDAALTLMAGCAATFAPEFGGWVAVVDDRLRTSEAGLLIAGDAAGTCDVSTALEEGRYAGASAAALLGLLSDAGLTDARRAYEASAPGRIAVRRGLEPTYAQPYE